MVIKTDNELEMASTEDSRNNSEQQLQHTNQHNRQSLIKVGHVYSVKRIDDEWCPAEVLETRVLKSKQIEYFVHFENSKNRFYPLLIYLFICP